MNVATITFCFAFAYCAAQNWERLPSLAIEISTRGSELWMINPDRQINRWNGSNWQLMPGGAERVGASPDGWTWVVNNLDVIYRWNNTVNNWDRMPGSLVQISAMSKDRALGVDRAGNISLWENNEWRRLPGVGVATWAAIGDGDERWVVNSEQQVFRWNLSTNNWDRMPGAFVNIDVQNPCRVIAIDEQIRIFVWKNNGWQQISGGGIRSAINENNYYIANRVQAIWRGP